MYDFFQDDLDPKETYEMHNYDEIISKTYSEPNTIIQKKEEHSVAFHKSKWTTIEDRLLRKGVEIYGIKNWSAVAALVPNRNSKQCRERWIDQLNPNLKRDGWTPQEDQQLLMLQKRYGNLWVKIARFLPGSSSNAIKNRYNWLVKKRNALISQIEKPLSSLPDMYDNNISTTLFKNDEDEILCDYDDSIDFDLKFEQEESQSCPINDNLLWL